MQRTTARWTTTTSFPQIKGAEKFTTTSTIRRSMLLQTVECSQKCPKRSCVLAPVAITSPMYPRTSLAIKHHPRCRIVIAVPTCSTRVIHSAHLSSSPSSKPSSRQILGLIMLRANRSENGPFPHETTCIVKSSTSVHSKPHSLRQNPILQARRSLLPLLSFLLKIISRKRAGTARSSRGSATSTASVTSQGPMVSHVS